VIGDDLSQLLGGRIPADHSRQAVALKELPRWAATAGPAARVLDLGCGEGASVDRFRAVDPAVRWVGVDIGDSAEAQARRRDDAEFHAFDGETLPFADASFDLVWCKQVLEHVRRPEPLLTEVARVLAPGGSFAGSTSQLEPFHSRSTANPTPYGLALALERAGLEVVELRPSIDALTLIVRRLVGGGRIFERWWDRESPLNRLIELYGRRKGLDARSVNAAKLVFCGQFTFVARRPA
jgi:SAM-dependent methyltransferase